jgi:hypothetical protein
MQIETKDPQPRFSQMFNLESSDLIENLMDWYQPARFIREIEDYNKNLSITNSISDED